MKKIIHISLTILLMLIGKVGFSQDVTIEIHSMYDGTSYIDDCGTIDLGSNTILNINFWVTLEKSSNYTVGDGELKIYLVPYSGASPILDSSTSYTSSAWNGNFIDKYYPMQLSASMFNTSGGGLYAEFQETGVDPIASCNYPIIKDELPSFTISPSNTTVECGSTNSKIFTVNDQNVPSGSTLTYNWIVGNTWLRNGSPAGNFTTTSNSITLEPNTYPPDNVKVTPVLDGQNYPQLTSNVSLADFNTVFEISGPSILCTSAMYSIDNLPAGYLVTWSLSNSNIASIQTFGNIANLTSISNGDTVLTASIKNPCSQQVSATKNIHIGHPDFPAAEMTGDDNPLEGELKFYSVEEAEEATSYEWHFEHNGVTGAFVFGWEIYSGQGTTTLQALVGNKGYTNVVCKALNSCGFAIKNKLVSVRDINDPCPDDEFIKMLSNPIKNDNFSTKQFEVIDPCDDLMGNKSNRLFTVSILDTFGNTVLTKTQKSNSFELENLKAGVYFIRYLTKKGNTISKTIIVE